MSSSSQLQGKSFELCHPILQVDSIYYQILSSIVNLYIPSNHPKHFILVNSEFFSSEVRVSLTTLQRLEILLLNTSLIVNAYKAT